MKLKISPLLICFSSVVFAAPAIESAAINDISVTSSIVNKTVQLKINSTYPADIIITNVSQYTNNGNACATSNSQYAVKPNTSQLIFPFTSKDQANCFSQVLLFKRYTNGTYPRILGFYDKTFDNQNFNDYLTDWGSYIVTPVVFKISYTFQNITTQKGVVKYFIYKVSE